MRVILDTNIFISAVLGGRLGVIVDEWKAGKFKLIVTDSIAREYPDVINRPKFKIPQGEIISVSDYLLQLAEFVTPEEEIQVIVADPTDGWKASNPLPAVIK
ncbi:MAG: PIN domain-containing protein [Anaerolineae bacterium]|nr:PIN domain-containing protein [Anaerolineae bacterium]MCI0608107.1 PIN domain-containing protein [Anaerolineae bacterium]